MSRSTSYVICIILSLMLLVGSSMVAPVQATVPPVAVVRLNMISYGDHTPAYESRIFNILPEYIIDNPAHGFWGEVQGYDDVGLLHDVAGYQAAGMKVIGYITSGYEGRFTRDGLDPSLFTLEANKCMIRNMVELDGVDGIFIDECSEQPDATSKAYLSELVDYIHSFGKIAWGNTGVDQFDEWFFTECGFDLMNSTEDWHGQSLSQVQQDWGHRISVTSYRSCNTVQDAYELTIDAWEKGLAYCYINNSEYETIAPWFEEYVTLLRNHEQDKQPPYTTGHIPAKSSVNVLPDTQIFLHIKDDGSGIDQSSITMTAEGSIVYPTITGTRAEYQLSYNPPADFYYGQVIDITIDAKDFASPPNTMTQDVYSFTIKKVNNPPVLGYIGDQSCNIGELLEFSISASDPDGDSLSFSALNLPKEASFDPSMQTFSWIPVTAGVYPNIYFKVTDDSLSNYNKITITVHELNSPPVLDAIGNKTVTKGESLTFTISASDPDNDDLIFSASNLPQGASFNPLTQTFSWTPNKEGIYTNVNFTVTDGSLSYSSDIIVTVLKSKNCNNQHGTYQQKGSHPRSYNLLLLDMRRFILRGNR